MMRCKQPFANMRQKQKKFTSPRPPLLIKGESIEKVETFKYLGTLISEDLKWGKNIYSIT